MTVPRRRLRAVLLGSGLALFACVPVGSSGPDADGEGPGGAPESGPAEPPGLVFASKRGGTYDIYAASLESGRVEALTTGPGADLFPAPSPDGALVAFASDRDGAFALHVLEVATRAVRQIPTGLPIASMPSFSPDGATIYFEARSAPDAPSGIYAVPAAGGEVRRLTDGVARGAAPAAAPDGETVYFVSDRSGTYEIYAMDAEGGDARAVTRGASVLGSPAVSPTGRHLAFSQLASSELALAQVVLLDLETGEQTVLTARADSEPRFSPAGDRLAITSARDGNQEVYVVASDASDASVAGEALRVTSDEAIDGSAAFLPRPP